MHISERARRAEGCTWQVYAAAAELEYQMGTGATAVVSEEEEEHGETICSTSAPAFAIQLH